MEWQLQPSPLRRQYGNDQGLNPVQGLQYSPIFTDVHLTTTAVFNSTTLVDTSLSLPVKKHEQFLVRFDLDIGDALSTTGIKIAITTPGSPLNTSLFGYLVADSNVVKRLASAVAGATLDFTAASLAGATAGWLRLNYWFRNGLNDGSLTLQYAQSTSSGSAISLRAGSFFIATGKSNT